MEERIKILKIEPGKAPFVKEIENNYNSCRREVRGLIDCIDGRDGCVTVINDMGKINGMEPNRRYGKEIICGPFFICGDSPEGDFTSLTDKQIEQYSKEYAEIPQFTGQEPELEPKMTVLGF